MTCQHCEATIKTSLEDLPGLVKTEADYVNGLVIMETEEHSFSSGEVISRLEKQGYKAREISKYQKILTAYSPVILAAVLVSLIYLIASRTGLMNRIPEIDQTMSYPVLFLTGLMTSVHCIGMCGGINLSQSSALSVDVKKITIFKRGLRYNLGRLISYTILGGIVGGVGAVFSLSLIIQGIIVTLAGIIMIIMGLNMLGLLSALKRFVPVMPSTAGVFLFKSTRKRSPFIVGLLNGLMPCGPLQSMQIYALSTGSIIQGAFSMFLFSAGTIPLVLTFGTMGALFSKTSQKNILKISALLIVLLGGSMISRGLSLNGINIVQENSSSSGIDAAVAEIQGNIQTVTSRVSPSAYEPIVVQAGIPVRWYLEAGEADITGCNNAIIIPKYGIQQKLKAGKTQVEFTPDKSGILPFSCWMGMINSHILIVDDLNNFDPDLLDKKAESSQQQVEIQIPVFTTDDIALSKITDGLQESSLRIHEEGFTPSVTVMQRSMKTRWTFVPENITEKNSRLVFPSYKTRLDVQENRNQTIELEPDDDFYFYSDQGDFLGFVIMVDDVEKVDRDKILTIVNSYISQ